MDYNAMVSALMARANPFQQQRMQAATPEQTAMAQQRWGAANPEQQAAFMTQAQAQLAKPPVTPPDPMQAELQRMAARPRPGGGFPGAQRPPMFQYPAPHMAQGSGNFMEVLGKRR